jgi:hypothetical protein
MRGDLAVAVDIDANIDAAEIGRIKPHLEARLAALHRGCDFDGEPVDRYRRSGCGHHSECGRS